MSSLQVDDVELCYETHGHGDPLVVIGGLGLAVSETQPFLPPSGAPATAELTCRADA